MKRFLLFIFLLPAIQLFAQGLSNRGKEFWLGYGHNTLFTASAPIFGVNAQTLVLYLSAEQTANVTVSINGTAYSQNYTVPAGTVVTTGAIPKSGANDARLTAEGKFTTGIHIVSDVPIVAYAHQFGAAAAGATMLMPVETYGYTYYSLNYTQKTNTSPAYSWFFVVASENNTRVEITPSGLTEGGRAAGVPFNVDLNKGEIYNVFGKVNGILGNDMTGSKVKSVAGLDNKCHPVGVFSGCSRIVICGNSGDMMQQQIFPLSAWGKEYLTYPTAQSGNAALTNPNYFRIAVKDPATVVKKNGTALTGLNNGFYYEYTSNMADYIQADKPVLVSQYTPSMTSCATYTGNGDPEMFYLSPIEQGINKASFFSTFNQLILTNYVVVITKTSDLPSLTIDGSSTFNFTTIHPNNNQYSVVVKQVSSNSQHTIKSSGTFIATAYGFGNVESYGYNAGTLVNNLEILPFITNTFDQTGITLSACTRSPFRIGVKTVLNPTQMTWLFSQVNGLLPNADTTLINPVPDDSALVNAVKYYEYDLPRDYYFADTGTYTIPLSVTAPEIDNCNNTTTVYFTVRVDLPPKPDFNVAYSSCKDDTAHFTSTGSAGFNIASWLWMFDDGTTDSVANPVKVFATEATHLTHIRVISNTGCIGDTIKPVVTNPKPVATFGISPLPVCEGATITFTDTSSFGGTLQSWYWNFGDGNIVNNNSNVAQTHPYPTAGTYTIKHFAKSSGSCKSDTAIKVMSVFAKPIVKFGADAGCVSDSIVHFHDSTTISDGQALHYLWNFGDANATTSNPNSDTVKNPTHLYIVAGSYTVTLTVTTANGCSSNNMMQIQVFPNPVVVFTINSAIQCLNNNSFVFNNTSSVAPGSLTYSWNFGDGNTSTATSPTHSYTATGTFAVKLIVTSNNGCKDSVTHSVTVSPSFVVAFTINDSTQCLIGNSFIFTNASSIATGTLSYNWNFGDGNTAITTHASHTYLASGNYSVTLVATANTGCKDSVSKLVDVYPKPVAVFTISDSEQCLSGNSFGFSNASTLISGTANYSWNFGDGNTSNLFSPTHTYVTAGSFVVTLIVASNNGCVDSVKHAVTVGASPTVAFTTNDSTQCFRGNSFVFTNASTIAAGTLAYNWNFGNGNTATTTHASHVYAGIGNYTVTLVATSNTGCKDSSSKPVVVYQQPVAVFTVNDSTQCLSGNNFVFSNASTVASSANYSWSFGDGNTSTSFSPIHTYATAGSFIVTLVVTSNTGCVDSVKHNATLGTTAVIASVSNNSPLCTGQALNLSTTTIAGAIYSWSGPNSFTSSLQNPSVTNVSTADSGVYSLTVTVNGCTSAASTTLVVINQTPLSPIVNSSLQVCAGQPINLTASGAGGNYNWTGPNSFTSNQQNSTIATATAANAGAYSVTVTVNGCVSPAAITNVVVNPTPAAPTVTSNNPLCVGATLNLQASNVAGGSYSWNGPNSYSSASQNPFINNVTASNAGVYVVRVTVNGCQSVIAQTTVVINPSPAPPVASNNGPLCAGGILNLNASTISSAVYSWSGPNNFSSSLQNPIINNASVSNAGVYSVSVSVNGCTSTAATTTVVVNVPLTTPSVASNSPLCVGQTLNLFAGSLALATYSWSGPNGFTSSLQNPSVSNVTAANAGTYIVIATANGCTSAAASVSVAVNTVPVVSASNNSPFCEGETLRLNASNVAGVTYQWTGPNSFTSVSQGPTISNATIANAGTYSVSANNGCTSAPATTIVIINPTPSVYAGPDIIVSESGSAQLHPIVTNGVSYLWSPNLYLNSNTLLTPVTYPANDILYTLKVTGAGNCNASDSVSVKVLRELNVPNVFTPNGDGKNDTWVLRNLDKYYGCTVDVFTRYGEKVFNSIGYEQAWNGSSNGKPLPVGTYYYIIEPKNGMKKMAGWVTILR